MAGWTTSGLGGAVAPVGTLNTMPGRGLVAWRQSPTTYVQSTDGSGTSCSSQPCVDSYDRIAWSAIEGALGDYSAGFGLIDGELANAQTRGGRHTLRVYCLWDAHGVRVPAYLQDPSYNGYYISWSTTNDTWVPDWNNAAFLARVQALLAALGGRYNGNPYLKDFQIGIYGDFGEFHVTGFPSNGPNGQVSITTANVQQIIDWHYQYFSKTRVSSTLTEQRAASYCFSKSPAIPSSMFRDSGGDASFLDIDQDNASTGSVGQHSNCILAEWTDNSTAAFVPGISYNDQTRPLTNKYCAKLAIQSSSYCVWNVSYRKAGNYPQPVFDVGTANPYGFTTLRVAMRAFDNGGLTNERPQFMMSIMGTGASGHATLDGSGHVNGAVLDAGGSGYQSPSIAVTAAGAGGGSGATFPNPTVTAGVITAIAAPSAGGSLYITPPDLRITDAGAIPAHVGIFSLPTGACHNEAGTQIANRLPQTGSWTYYDIPLDTLYGAARPAHLYIGAIEIEFVATRTAGDAFYVGQLGFNTGFGTPMLYTIYDGSLPGFPGAWRSSVAPSVRKGPFHVEPDGTSTILGNTGSGLNAVVNIYDIASVANGTMGFGYTSGTTQNKADWDNLNSGAEYGSASQYSASGYQYQYQNVQLPPHVYPATTIPVSLFGDNQGASVDWEGYTYQWRLTSSGVVVWTQKANINLNTLTPAAGVSPAALSFLHDEIVIPSSLSGSTLVLQLVLTHPVLPALILNNLATLTPA